MSTKTAALEKTVAPTATPAAIPAGLADCGPIENATPTAGPTAIAPTDVLAPLRNDKFHDPISELEELLSQARRSFLLGAGCSVCAGLPMMDALTTEVQQLLDATHKPILDDITASFNGSSRVTIEDFMSELVDHISLADRRVLRKASSPSATINGKQYDHKLLREALQKIKAAVATVISRKDTLKHIETHRAFIRAVHGTLKSGKTAGARHAVDYFTLNYDTLVEDALCLERIPLSDGFMGGATAWWNTDEFTSRKGDARLFKLHGSIDWTMCEGDVFPRRIRDGLSVPDRHEHVLIWPAATKYREAQRDPYAQLIAYFRASLRPTDTAQTVLCICGYAFADEHINIEIERALRESGDNLTVVILTSDEKPQGQAAKWQADASIGKRIRFYADRGFFHGDKVVESSTSLPWWKFEVLTQLLGGAR